MTSHAITTLVDRRRTIMREMEVLQTELKEHAKAVEHLDETIRLLDPHYPLDGLAPKRPYKEDQIFRPGEASVLALEVLRDNRRTMSTTEITQAILQRKGSPQVTRQQFETLNRKISAGLNSKFRIGMLRKAGRVQGSNRSVI